MPDSCDHLVLGADLQALPQVLQGLEAIAEREGWPVRTVLGLTISLDEAFTNVVSYAFDPPAAEPAIEVSCSTEAHRIVVELRDNGRPHDPTAGEPPALATSLDEAVIGGHGVRLMRHYLHDLTYRREAGWNCLSMAMLRS